MSSDVLIIGAGVAGLAAAEALSRSGASVTLVERKPFVGGRAYSYPHPALGEVIDSQHVLVGCCTNVIDLLNRAGAANRLRWYDRIPFLTPGPNGARISEIGAGMLPPPMHSTFSFLEAGFLSLNDKTRIATGLLHFFRGYPESDSEPFSEWLKRTHQSEVAIRRFWEPLVVSTLNDTFERCSTKYAGQVFHELFLKSAEGGRQAVPTVPLSELFAEVAALAERQGTELRLKTSVDRICRMNGEWCAETSSGERLSAPSLVLALPFEQAARLIGTLPEGSSQRIHLETALPHFRHAPITTIHLWFDRHVTHLDQAALLDTRIQWMFNKSQIRRLAGDGQYLELVISASFAEVEMARDQILTNAIAELASFFPEVRQAKLLKSGVLKEARATFSVTPGLDKWRPAADAGNGLFLAGDWTRTGWPATMEGAARSGRLAAEAVAKASFLTPDLPASGLMRWIVQ